jgi:hypothetical protein
MRSSAPASNTRLDESHSRNFFRIIALSRIMRVPEFLNIDRPLGAASPLLSDETPWAPILLSITGAAMLGVAAARLTMTRDY